jgi:hypothetical protein
MRTPNIRHSDVCLSLWARATELSRDYTVTARRYGEAAANRMRQEADHAVREWEKVDALCPVTLTIKRPKRDRRSRLATILDQPAILEDDIETQRTWSRETFGPDQRLHGVVDHILKELEEIVGTEALANILVDRMFGPSALRIEQAGNPGDASEWADLIVLAIDGATRQGISPGDLIDAYHAKMEKNYRRQWPDWRDFGEHEAIEHIRGGEHD